MELQDVQYSHNDTLKFISEKGVVDHSCILNVHIGDLNDFQQAVEKEYEWRLKLNK